MDKHIKINKEATDLLVEGAVALAEIVGQTLGADGKHVFVEHPTVGIPVSTKDGVTVATWVRFEDRFKNMGAGIVKYAAKKTAMEAGDGTTTCTLLSAYLIKEGMKKVDLGANARELSKGMKMASEAIVKELESVAQTIDNTDDLVHRVAMVSSNHDKEMADLVTEVIQKIGKDGVINIVKTVGQKTKLDYVEGMLVNTTWSHYDFVNTDRNECELENVAIIICDYDVSKAEEVGRIIEIIATHYSGGISRDKDDAQGSFRKVDSYLFIARSVIGGALASLAKSKIEGGLKVCAVKAPYGDDFRSILDDIAVVTGGHVVAEESGFSIDRMNPHVECGWAKSVRVTTDGMIIVGADGSDENIAKRTVKIKDLSEKENNVTLKERFQERAARINSQVARLHISGENEAAMNERADRADDTRRAVKSALEEGITVGGGVAYLNAMKVLDGMDMLGVELVRQALFVPIKTMLGNSGLTSDQINDLIGDIRISSNEHIGYNSLTTELEDLMKSGIIDPVKVLRCAIENSITVTDQILNTGAALYFLPDETQNA